MKTKFLPKLLLLSLFCVSLNSCTAEEILNYTQGATATTSTTSTSTTMDATATTNSSSVADPGLEPVVTRPR
jgi:hypothetical protein